MKTLLEYLIDVYAGTPLFEMAANQKDCEKRVASQFENIIETAVLLTYFRVSGLPTTNKEHWKRELRTAIYNAGNFTLKGNNTIARRKRLVSGEFKKWEMYDYGHLYRTAQNKFDYEDETLYGTHPDAERWLNESVAAVLNQMQDIENLIVAKYDRNIVTQYLNNTY